MSAINIMCKECEYWYGDNNLTYTGCQLGMTNVELTSYYLDNKLIKRKIGLNKKCRLFKTRKEENG